MKYSVCFISLIIIYNSPMTYLQSTKRVPGISGCSYFGSTKETCNTPSVSVNELPDECSSYFYSGLTVDNVSFINYKHPEKDNQNYIQNLLFSSNNKPTFLYYGYPDDKKWIDAVKNNSEHAIMEMENLKKFLEPYHNVAGLVLENITPMQGTTDFDNYTENFQAYIKEMKNSFPDFTVGFEIFGQTLIDFQDQDHPPLWLDFSLLDPIIDFYVINVNKLNDCTEEFKVGGTAPLTGDVFYTVDIVNGFVTQLGIPGNKTIFMYKAGPWKVGQNLTECDATTELVCGKPNFDGFCADNTQSFFDKGKFAVQNGAGFIAKDLDLLDDPFNKCQCHDGSYPAFFALLAGFEFNKTEIPQKCRNFDKS